MLNLFMQWMAIQLSFFPTQNITLQQALDKHLVEATVSSNPTGTHYMLPVIIHIKNNSGTAQQILVENGRTFGPADSAYQPIIVIREELISLAPGETRDVKLNGMCFNASKSAPHKDGMTYTINPVAKGQLAELTAYLQKNMYEGYAAQHAIWAISNGDDLEDIIDWDEKKALDLARYVSTLTGRPMPEPPKPNDYKRSFRATPTSTIGGKFEFTLLKTTEVHIAMFDVNGIVVRELYYNPAEKPGDRSFEYVFDSTVYTDPVYYIRYLENKQVYMEFKID